MAASASNRSDAGSDTASDTKKSRRRRNKKSSKPGADTGSDTAATASDVSDRAKRKTKTKRTPETPATAVPAAKPTATAEPTSRRKNDTRDSRRSSDRRPETAGEADAKSTQIHYKRDSNFDLSWYSNELRKLVRPPFIPFSPPFSPTPSSEMLEAALTLTLAGDFGRMVIRRCPAYFRTHRTMGYLRLRCHICDCLGGVAYCGSGGVFYFGVSFRWDYTDAKQE